MQRKLLVAVVAVLAVGGMAVGAVGTGGFLGDADQPNDAAPATDTEQPTPAGNDTVAFDDGTPVELEASEDATLSGMTTLDADTELSIRVQSADDTTPRFFQSVEATVADDGTFAAAFDLADITSEREVTVSVHAPNTTAEVDGRVVAPEGGFTEPTEREDDRTVSFDGDDPIELVATENATVSGTTTAETGSEIHVQIRSIDDGAQFLMGRTATVDSDGSFTVMFDLHEIYEQREIEISAVGDDWRQSASGTIVAPESGFPDVDGVEATIDGDQPIDLTVAASETVSGSTNLDAGTEVNVEIRNESDGHLLAVDETTVGEDGAFTANVDLSMAEPDQNVTIELAVYRETVTTADGRVAES